VVTDGQVHARTVRRGIEANDMVEIVSGLRAGETVVVARPPTSRKDGRSGSRPVIGRLLLLLHIASRHLLMRRRQTLVATSGVAVGVGFFLAVSALMVGSQADFVRQLIDVAPHIIISDELRSPAPQPGGAPFPTAPWCCTARSATRCAVSRTGRR
jgi:hypothetical protein